MLSAGFTVNLEYSLLVLHDEVPSIIYIDCICSYFVSLILASLHGVLSVCDQECIYILIDSSLYSTCNIAHRFQTIIFRSKSKGLLKLFC